MLAHLIVIMTFCVMALVTFCGDIVNCSLSTSSTSTSWRRSSLSRSPPSSMCSNSSSSGDQARGACPIACNYSICGQFIVVRGADEERYLPLLPFGFFLVSLPHGSWRSVPSVFDIRTASRTLTDSLPSFLNDFLTAILACGHDTDQ